MAQLDANQAGGITWRIGGFIYTLIEGKENHPVTYVTWNNAAIFTNWLSGKAGAIYGNLGSNKYYNSRYNGPSNSAWGMERYLCQS